MFKINLFATRVLFLCMMLVALSGQEVSASSGLGLQWCSPGELGKNGKSPARIPASTYGYDSGDFFYNAKVGLFEDPDNSQSLWWSFTDPAGEWLNSHIYDVDDLTTGLRVNPQKVLCDSRDKVHRFILAKESQTLPAYYSYLQSRNPFQSSTKLCGYPPYDNNYHTGLTNLSGANENDDYCSFITMKVRAYQEGTGGGGINIGSGGFSFLAATPLKAPEEVLVSCHSKVSGSWKRAPESLWC